VVAAAVDDGASASLSNNVSPPTFRQGVSGLAAFVAADLIFASLPGLTALPTTPELGGIGSSTAADAIELTRVSDTVGVRADFGAGGSQDLLALGAGPNAAPASGSELDAGKVKEEPTETAVFPSPALLHPSATEDHASASLSMSSGMLWEVLFETDMLPKRGLAFQNAPAAEAASLANLLRHTAAATPGSVVGTAAQRVVWLDALAAISALAAGCLTGWALIAPRVRTRKPVNLDLNLFNE
jgi:hypothetical protein